MDYRLSNKAEQYLRRIYQYSLQNFGDSQAVAYLTGIEEAIQLVANNDALAQRVDDIRKGYSRYFNQEHVIYFQNKKTHILVVRVLHQQMKVSLHIE